MNELELKYGCNPNQKPARIFMRDGSDLPVTVLMESPATSTSWTRSTPGSWCRS